MCGIAGYIGRKKFKNLKIQNILSTMRRRGPDSNGFKEIKFEKKNLSLFFSRLSIIDAKNNKANQPYVFKDSTLVFNGEIYNYIELRDELKKEGYRFETGSDTEVLIKVLDCWGEKGINKLEGMWAFYYFNHKKKIGILSRDRFGEKPLFYFHSKNEFIFGSEIKIIKKILDKKLQINYGRIENLLRFGYKILFKSNETYFKNINNFPKGHYYLFKNNKIIKNKYWKINYRPNKNLAKNNFRSIKESLYNSIKLRLRSDVPIAFLLSGGIDSNALVSIAKKHFNQNVSTFSIVNKDKKFDESKYINLAQKNLKTDHTNLKFDFKKINFLKNLRDQIIYHDSPVTMVNSFLQFELLKIIKKKGFKVVIGGIGSDELFSGYYDHHLLYLNEIKKNKKLFNKSLDNWSNHILPIVRNKDLQKFNLYIKNKNFRDHVFQFDEFKNKIFKKKSKTNFHEENFCKSLMKNRMINELQNEIVPGGLKEDDLNSMYNSIENRSPYLDTKLFQDCLNMPSEYYIKDGMAKWPLRKIIKGLIPNEIRLKKEKVGFNTSISDVIDFKNKKNINFLLSDSNIFKIINKKSLINLLNKRYFSGVESNFLFTFISSKIFLENFE